MSTEQQPPTEATSAQQTPQELALSAEPAPAIIARAGTYYRNARYIMFAIIVLMGFWFIYDGFVKYPAHNREFDRLSQLLADMDNNPKTKNEPEFLRISTQRKALGEKHDDFSMLLQKLLGFTLPPVGVGLLVYWLRKSRGEIRLENKVLTVPGLPAVALDQVDELDKDLWDKKGIAFVYYTLADKTTGKLRLDDFIYQARPIRDIVKSIEDEMKAQDELIAQTRKSATEIPVTPVPAN